MQMLCPHCQVKGKVKDELVGKEVRCPKCEETFVVEGIEAISTNDTPITTEIPQPKLVEEMNNLAACSKCGFTFSEEFTTTQNDQKLCAICAAL